jgi:cobalamin biosynthesis protein CobW
MTANATRVPCTVVTGFLGAGKTTLIRNLLEQSAGKRLALIVNEFGDVGVDGEILKGCGIDTCPEENIVELANGCICCTVADDFVPALDQILSRTPKIDHILIETSGLALPKPLGEKPRHRGRRHCRGRWSGPCRGQGRLRYGRTRRPARRRRVARP